MCGIVGLLRRDGRDVDASALDAMLDAIRHRGPDDRGVAVDGPCALGHVRLSILDLTDRAHQPMETPDGQGVLVYNGEVYNFAALRRELEAEGVTFTSRGDTEVVLKALHRWGPRAATPRFDGMFAFAYLDRRDGTVWLGRDRLGIKGLSITECAGTLLFASEIKALLAHPRVTPRADRSRIAHYLLYHRADPRGLVFEGIRTIAPGSLVRVRGEATEEIRWYDVAEDLDVDRILAARRTTVRETVDSVRDLLTRSVRMHLVSDAPLAAMCSGGVDSSLVAALARDERPDLQAYVADVGGGESEFDQAHTAAAHIGVPLRRIPVDRALFLRLWPDVIRHLETPSSHPSDAPLLAVARACHDDGVKVLLTGEGADELFAGYPWYDRTHALWRKARRRARLPRLLAGQTGRRWKRWRGLPHPRVLFRDDVEQRRRLMAAVGAETEARRWQLAEHVARVEPPEDRAVLVHQLDDLSLHLGWILRRHDRLAMAASIEARVPFLENELIDFALHLPLHVKLHRRRGKWALKRYADERLPKRVVHATKKGFPVGDAHWARAEGLLTDEGVVPDLLHWSRPVTDRMLRECAAEPRLRYHLVSLEIWGRLFLRGEAPDGIAEQLLHL